MFILSLPLFPVWTNELYKLQVHVRGIATSIAWLGVCKTAFSAQLLCRLQPLCNLVSTFAFFPPVFFFKKKTLPFSPPHFHVKQH